jgi:diguanylate cyclase (GGDEF)-like protein
MPLSHSMLLITSTSALTVGACLLLVSWLQNRTMRALAFWAGAFALGALGVALIAAQGKIPDFWSILIANAILAAAYGIMWTGVRNFEGRRTSVPLMLAGTLVWLAACQFEAFYGSQMARTTLTSAIFVAYSVLSAVEIWRGRDEKLNSRWPIIVLLLGNVLFFLIRIPLLGSRPSQVHAAEIDLAIFSFIIFETIFYASCLVYMFGGMAKERIANRYMQASLTDPLTGVANRRDFLQRGHALLGRSNFEQSSSVLLLIDIDNFKSINDSYGHHTGDQVLLEFSRVVASVLRPQDIFGRVGGEEFGCFIPRASLRDGRDIAERIRERSEAALLQVTEGTVSVTVSIGIALSAGAHQDFIALMRAADLALYRAKANGRNRVECAPVDTEESSWSASAA